MHPVLVHGFIVKSKRMVTLFRGYRSINISLSISLEGSRRGLAFQGFSKGLFGLCPKPKKINVELLITQSSSEHSYLQ